MSQREQDTGTNRGTKMCIAGGFFLPFFSPYHRSCEALSQNPSKTSNHILSGAISGQMQPWRRLQCSLPTVCTWLQWCCCVICVFWCSGAAAQLSSLSQNQRGLNSSGTFCAEVSILWLHQQGLHTVQRCENYCQLKFFSGWKEKKMKKWFSTGGSQPRIESQRCFDSNATLCPSIVQPPQNWD